MKMIGSLGLLNLDGAIPLYRWSVKNERLIKQIRIVYGFCF